MPSDVRRYWSHRKGYREPLTGEFWSAFEALLRRLIDQTHGGHHQAGIFGNLVKSQENVYGRHIGWSDSALNAAVREQLGRSYSPFTNYSDKPNEERHVLDFIEAFHHLAVTAQKSFYSSQVNQLLKRLNQPYELVDGELHFRGSEVLDEPVERLDGLVISDVELRKYLGAAREAFFDARNDRRLEGLRALYDGFERLKTLREGNKRDSASKIVEELAHFEELRPQFDILFRELTKIGNITNIRHSESDRVVIDQDPVLIEYLFYSVWALMRAVLIREEKNPLPTTDKPLSD